VEWEGKCLFRRVYSDNNVTAQVGLLSIWPGRSFDFDPAYIVLILDGPYRISYEKSVDYGLNDCYFACVVKCRLAFCTHSENKTVS